ncbi:MAG: hypothetical protein ACHBN1_32345 [Heteroscytonema crispum UTEX LB 1556]
MVILTHMPILTLLTAVKTAWGVFPPRSRQPSGFHTTRVIFVNQYFAWSNQAFTAGKYLEIFLDFKVLLVGFDDSRTIL